MRVPPKIAQRLQKAYPRPQIHPDWLDGCYDWIIEEHHPNPATDEQTIYTFIEEQFLSAKLEDVAQPGTGFPQDILTGVKRINGLLVELTAITEIGQSAFNLQTVFQARVEREKMGEAEAEIALDDEGPVSKYPRSMLKFELSDGEFSIYGIEYRPLPQIILGETPLGFKMMLNDVLVRNGIAFLEPKNVTLKGGMNAEYDEDRDNKFSRSLRIRLGQPVADQAPGEHASEQGIRAPLQEMPEPPVPKAEVSGHQHSDDEDQPRRRRVPNPQPPSTPPRASQRQSTLVQSPYFSTRPNSHSNGRAIATNPRVSSAHSVISIHSDDGGPPFIARNVSRALDDDEISYDYDDDSELDAEFMAGIDAAESAALAATNSSQAREPVISILDDDDDDKENQAVPLRHVRRRVLSEDVDIIELSD